MTALVVSLLLQLFFARHCCNSVCLFPLRQHKEHTRAATTQLELSYSLLLLVLLACVVGAGAGAIGTLFRIFLEHADAWRDAPSRMRLATKLRRHTGAASSWKKGRNWQTCPVLHQFGWLGPLLEDRM